jgi:hypothetical protein
MTERAPNRSSSHPDSGASANIPNVCAESIAPIAPRSAPCMCIDSGAAVMTATMTSCAVIIVAAAVRPPAPEPATGVGLVGRAAVETSSAPRAATRAKTNGPAIGSWPVVAAMCWAGIMSSGPPTAPAVPAQTIAPIAVPGRSGSRSAAA